MIFFGYFIRIITKKKPLYFGLFFVFILRFEKLRFFSVINGTSQISQKYIFIPIYNKYKFAHFSHKPRFSLPNMISLSSLSPSLITQHTHTETLNLKQGLYFFYT
jgi:hypothetical protein